MVKVSDFISFLKDGGFFNDFVTEVKTHGIPSFRDFEGTDEELVTALWNKVGKILPAHEILKAAFPWQLSDTGKWALAELLWKAKVAILRENDEVDEENLLNSIRNYFKSKGLLEEIEKYQRVAIKDHKNMLPEGCTVEMIQKEVVNFNPSSFLDGTFEFAKTETPEKWRDTNEDFKSWLDSIM